MALDFAQEKQRAHTYPDLLPPEQLSALIGLLETTLDPVRFSLSSIAARHTVRLPQKVKRPRGANPGPYDANSIKPISSIASPPSRFNPKAVPAVLKKTLNTYRSTAGTRTAIYPETGLIGEG